VGNIIEQLLRSVELGAGPELPLALAAAEKQLKASQLLCCDPSLASVVDPGTHVLMLECIKDIDMNTEVLQEIIGAGSLQSPPPVKKELLQEVAKVKAIKGFVLSRYSSFFTSRLLSSPSPARRRNVRLTHLVSLCARSIRLNLKCCNCWRYKEKTF
jgi:hypothetical protein